MLFHDGSPLDAAAVKASFDGIETDNARLLRLLNIRDQRRGGRDLQDGEGSHALTEPSAAIV